MYATKLNSLLSEGISPANINSLSKHLDEWFVAEPVLAVYVLRSIFRDLIAANFDDEQGVPSDKFDDIKRNLLSPVRRIAVILSSSHRADLNSSLDELARGMGKVVG